MDPHARDDYHHAPRGGLVRPRSRSRSPARSSHGPMDTRGRSPSPPRRNRSRSPMKSGRHRSPERSRERDSGRRSYRSRSYSRSRSPPRRYASAPRRAPGGRPLNAPNPDPSNVLGVFGLSILTTEPDLERLFGTYGRIEKVSIIYDRSPDFDGRITRKSRGFGFITFESLSGASAARDALDGTELHERQMRVDYSMTKRAHDPTPGRYMGDPRELRRERGPGSDHRGHGGGDRGYGGSDRGYGGNGDHDRGAAPRGRGYEEDYRRRRSPSPEPRRSRRSPSPRSRSIKPESR